MDLIENTIGKGTSVIDWFSILNLVSARGLALRIARVGQLHGTCSATENSGSFS